MRCNFDEDNRFLCISADIFDKDREKFFEEIEKIINKKKGIVKDYKTGKLLDAKSVFLIIQTIEITGVISENADLTHLQFFGLLGRVKFHEKQNQEVYNYFEEELSRVIVDHYEPVTSV